MPQLSGWFWLLIDVALVAMLGAAMIYGIVKWRQRRHDPVAERRRDDITRRLYHDEEVRRRVSGQK
jgi:hypothetical protein